MFKLLLTGGYTMVPLLICSVITLAVIIEKMIVLRFNRVIHPIVVQGISKVKNVKELNGLIVLCNRYKGAFSSIICNISRNSTLSKEANKEQTEMEGKVETNRLEKGLVVLEVIAAISPLLGLLGTVIGLVDVFQVVSKLGIGQTSAFSSGIAKALITTVVGLIIAIPSLVAHSYFSKKVKNLVLAMEKEATSLINNIYP